MEKPSFWPSLPKGLNVDILAQSPSNKEESCWKDWANLNLTNIRHSQDAFFLNDSNNV